jgi:membrane associated rhomboid family serine protease
MIPLSDANPTRRTPVVNWLLIAINVVVFLYEISLPTRQLNTLIASLGVTPTLVLRAIADPGTAPTRIWETLITSQFLHAGWLHLIGNMLYLWVFGDNIEDILGHFLYIFFYLVSGVAAGLVQSVIQGPSSIPSIGASGAIAGVLGAYLVLFPTTRIHTLIPIFFFATLAQIPALILIGWWFIQQFFYGVAALSSVASSGIAFWAHIGGFIAGVVLILPFIGRSRRRRSSWYYYNSP